MSKRKIAAAVLVVGAVVAAATACVLYWNYTRTQPSGTESKPVVLPPVVRRPQLRTKIVVDDPEVEVAMRGMVFSADSKTLATANDGDGGMITLWDVASGAKTGTLRVPHGCCAIASSPVANLLASSGDREIYLWDLDSHGFSELPVGHAFGQIHSLAFSPDGKKLASATDSDWILWDVAGRKAIGGALQGDFKIVAPFSPGNVDAVAFSPDGKVLASGWADCICFWDVESRKLIGYLDPGGNHSGLAAMDPASLAFSPDGKTVAAAMDDGEVKLWDWRAGKRIAAWKNCTRPAFSVDGAMLAVNGKLWAVGAGEDTAIAFPPGGGSVVFSPDGKTAASMGSGIRDFRFTGQTSWNSAICIWDLQPAAETWPRP